MRDDGTGLLGFDLDVYRCVARRSRCTTADVVDAIGEGENTVRQSFRRLADLGLVVGDDCSVQVAPGGPGVAFEVLQAQIERDYLTRRSAAADLRYDLTRILGEGLLSDSPGERQPVEELPTMKATQVRLLELAGHAQEEVLRMWPRMPEPISLAVTTDRMGLDPAIRPGIKVRIVCSTAFVHRNLAHGLDGADVRTVADPPLELHVFDRRVAVLVGTAAIQAAAASIIVRGPLAHVLHIFFETWWLQSRTPSADGVPITGEDEALLQLLADGVKDENAARQLGYSVRTVRRKISGLLERLDSVSRFQAGVHAARRRWV